MKKTISFILAFLIVAGFIVYPTFIFKTTASEILTYTVENGEVTVTGLTDTSLTSVTIPSTIEGYPVTSIGKGAFKKASLVTVVLPDTIKSIGEDAFSQCTKLETVNLPEGITSIENFAFNGCFNLNSIVFPTTLEKIGNLAFYTCKIANFSEIPANVSEMGSNPFGNCKNAGHLVSEHNKTFKKIGNCIVNTKTKVVVSGDPNGYIPSDGSVDKIGMCAYIDCDEIKELTIPSTITQIEMSAFSYCHNLTTLTIPSTVKEIGFAAFSGCSMLKSVVADEGFTKLGARTFGNCISLKEVTLPKSLAQLGGNTFEGCTSLEKITFYGNSFITDDFVPSDFFPAAGKLTVYYNPEYSKGFSTPSWGGYACFPISDETIIYGDADNSGSVDITDAIAVFYHVAKKEFLSDAACIRCDVNKDNVIDINDAIKIFYYVAKKTDSVSG